MTRKCELCRKPAQTNQHRLCDACANAMQRFVLITEYARLQQQKGASA
jgi:hypothetical protein